MWADSLYRSIFKVAIRSEITNELPSGVNSTGPVTVRCPVSRRANHWSGNVTCVSGRHSASQAITAASEAATTASQEAKSLRRN